MKKVFLSSLRNESPLPCHVVLSRFSCVWLCATLWTVAHQAPLTAGFSRQEYWSRLPFPSPIHVSILPQTLLLSRLIHLWINTIYLFKICKYIKNIIFEKNFRKPKKKKNSKCLDLHLPIILVRAIQNNKNN